MDAGIDKDRNGKIDLTEFMEFVRQSLTADLPASTMPYVEEEFFKRAAPVRGVERRFAGLDRGHLPRRAKARGSRSVRG